MSSESDRLQYVRLGRTGVVISRLCFGVLTVGPLQANLPLEEGAEVIAYALNRGINFLDTAEAYQTYPYIRRALELARVQPVIATKSYAYTRQGMKESLDRARDEMGIKTVDIFLLHEQENELTLAGHREALEFLFEARRKGWVRAVGISTHSVRGVVAGTKNEGIEVIHPIINLTGLGIMDGSREQMLAAMALAREKGKGLYAMKALGGGNLGQQAHRALSFVNSIPYIDAIAVGMKSKAEVDLNLTWIQGRRDPVLEEIVGTQGRNLLIESWCRGCGSCLEACRYEALELQEGRVEVKKEKCILCGYCSRYCPDFCIKIV